MTDDRMLDCEELVELLTDYLENSLDPATAAQVEAHVAACDECELYLAQMRETIATLGVLPAESISPVALERLLEAFREYRTT